MENSNELIQRINLCSRAVRALGLGTVEIDVVPDLRTRYFIRSARHRREVASFNTLERFEQYVFNALQHRRSATVCRTPPSGGYVGIASTGQAPSCDSHQKIYKV